MPKHLWLWIVALVAIGAAVWYRSQVLATPTPPEVRIAFVTAGSGPYWQLIANGARAAAEDQNVDLLIEMPKEAESVEQQTEILSDIDVKAVDGVAVSPLDAEGQTALINELAEDVFVITVDSDAPKSKRMSYVGTSNLQAGRRSARLVREAIPDGGKVAVAMSNETKDNMIERRAGFEETIAEPAIGADGEPVDATYEVVDFLIDGGSEERCRELVTKLLADHPDLACLVGMNSRHGAFFLDVLEDEDKLGKIALVVFDEQEETLDGIEAGHIYASVVQDPYLSGYEAVRTLAVLCRGNETQRPLAGSYSTFSVATSSVTKDNLAEFREELADRLNPEGDGDNASAEED
jgi:ribose transport system substrate-binding protein